MIYMIGGAPRVGKSTLARLILKRNQIPHVGADALFHMLKHAAPETGITDEIPHQERAEKFFPFLQKFIHYTQLGEKLYVIEGDSFLPKQVKELQKEYPISAVFLGVFVMTPETLQEFKGHNSWIDRISQEQLDLVPKMVMDISRLFENEAKKYELPYIDLAEDYTTQMETAYNELLETTLH